MCVVLLSLLVVGPDSAIGEGKNVIKGYVVRGTWDKLVRVRCQKWDIFVRLVIFIFLGEIVKWAREYDKVRQKMIKFGFLGGAKLRVYRRVQMTKR